MRFLINLFRKIMNIFGVQFLSLKNYKKLVACQNVMTQLGVKHTQLDGLLSVNSDLDVLHQTEKFAEHANSADSYFKKIQKQINQNPSRSMGGAGNAIESGHMAQYNEGRIAKMLLQEKLTSLELSQKKNSKSASSKKPALRKSK